MKKTNFNRNWKFKFGENLQDETLEKYADYDLIGLPHSFGIPYYGDNDFYVGYGCYQKTLHIESLQDKKLYLEFGAVFQAAEVYINGQYVGKHAGGYTAFILEITDRLKVGENNLFVRVNNLWNPVLAPRAGEHTFNGGIYRDVYLLEYPIAHIDWYGVCVKTQKTNGKDYKLHVTTDTVSCIGKTLETAVYNQENEQIAHCLTEITADRTETDLCLENPVLWDIQNPYLYKLVSKAGEDTLVTEFGVRTIEWTADHGFFLNGRHILLEGANVHQDHGGWGDAVTHSGIQRDVSIIKEGGFNFIRGSHYPHHSEFAKTCDRQGILFWSENVFWGIGGFGADGDWKSSAMPLKKEQFLPFENSLKQQLAEMIRVNRNSPSIICWSMGNEIFFSDKKVLDDARKLVRRMVEYSHTLDDTRPAAVGGVQRGDFDKIGDIAGYNGDGAYLFQNPPVPNMVAEYGSIAGYRPGKYDLYETQGSEKYYDWRSGRCIWCGFHHGSLAGIGNLGICDLYRLPLKAYYCQREHLRGLQPPAFSVKGKAARLEISADKTVFTADGTDDCMLVVRVLNDKGERVGGSYTITLKVTSGSALLPTGKVMVFSKEKKNCFDGMCAIEVRGYYAGKSTVEASCDGLQSTEIELTLEGKEKYSCQDIVYRPADIKTAEQNGKKINIIENRPCTVSSEQILGSFVCITSGEKQSCWSPAAEDEHPFIILDLEHCYSRYKIKIRKKCFSAFQCRLYTSLDKENWCLQEQNSKKTSYTVNEKSRYVKLEVNRSCKIKNIQIFSTEL